MKAFIAAFQHTQIEKERLPFGCSSDRIWNGLEAPSHTQSLNVDFVGITQIIMFLIPVFAHHTRNGYHIIWQSTSL